MADRRHIGTIHFGYQYNSKSELYVRSDLREILYEDAMSDHSDGWTSKKKQISKVQHGQRN